VEEKLQPFDNLHSVLEALREESEAQCVRKKRLCRWVVLLALISLLVFVVIWLTWGSASSPLPTQAAFLAVVAAVTGLVACRQKTAIRRAIALHDVAVVPFLFEALLMGDKLIALEARNALVGLLPHVQPEHASLFSRHQRQAMHSAMSSAPWRDPQFALLMVRCVRRIGLMDSLNPLETLERSARSLAEPDWVKVADCALEALADVRMRVAKSLIEGTAQPVAGFQRVGLG
jgi:hypothetical protein